MRKFHLNSFDPNRLSILFMAGGGENTFTKNHHIVKYFDQLDVNLIALELPGHGESHLEHTFSTDEYIEDYKQNMLEICKDLNKIAFIGFSLGGLLALKTVELDFLENKIKFVIVFGTGVTITEDQEKLIKFFASDEFFDLMRWTPIMKKYHGIGWENLLQTLNKILYIDSDIFSNDKILGNSNIPIYFILGENDEAFSIKLQQAKMNEYTNITFFELPGTRHFGYFTDSWDKSKETLDKCIPKLLN